MRSDLAKGSLTGALQVAVTTVMVLIAVPLFVRKLGQEAFGLFSLLALVGNVNTFANLGLNSALVRFLAEQGKTRESDHDIAVTLTLLLSVILPLTAGGFLFEQFVLYEVLNVPPALYDDAVWLYRAMLVSNVFVLLGGTFTAVLDAQGKVYLTNLCQILYSVVYWGLILGLIVYGLPLKTIGIATVVAAVLWFIVVGTSMLLTWGVPSVAGLTADWLAKVRKQLSYGIQLFMAGVLGFLFEPLTKLLLAHFLGVREVGVFDIGMRARAIVSGLMLRLLYPLYPLFARLDDHAQVRSLVHDVEQKSMLFVAPVLGIVILTARPLTELFFGANVDLIAPTIIWMVSSYLLCSFTVIPVYAFLMAKGHASKTVIVQALNMVTNAVVFFPTFGWLGYYAAVAGNVASNLATWILLLFLQWSFLRTLVFDRWQQILAVGAVIGLGLAFAFVSPLQHAGLYSVFGSPVLMVCVTVLVYRFLSVVTVKDVERYLGSGTYAARFCARLFCKAADSTVA